MTQEQILQAFNWSEEQKARIEAGFLAHKRTTSKKENPKPYRLTLITDVEVLKAEVNKMVETYKKREVKKDKVGGAIKAIKKDQRESINLMLSKAKALGFKDEEIAGAIKAMIKQRFQEQQDAMLAKINAM